MAATSSRSGRRRRRSRCCGSSPAAGSRRARPTRRRSPASCARRWGSRWRWATARSTSSTPTRTTTSTSACTAAGSWPGPSSTSASTRIGGCARTSSISTSSRPRTRRASRSSSGYSRPRVRDRVGSGSRDASIFVSVGAAPSRRSPLPAPSPCTHCTGRVWGGLVPSDDKKPQGQRAERGRSGQPRIPIASPAAWLVLIALALFLFRAFQDVGVRRIPYSQFKEMVRQGSFERVVIGPDWVRGVPKGVDGKPSEGDKGGQALPYMATRIPGGGDDLVAQVDKAGVPYDAVAGGGMGDLFWIWVAPVGLGLLFWFWMMRRMSGQMGQGPPGVMAFGKSKARVHVEPDTGVTFDDAAGIDEAVEELEEIVEFLKTPEKYRRLGGRIPKGVLLVRSEEH